MPEIFLAEGQVIRVGAIELEVRHTPGHTPGHVVFICHDAGVVFCGDLIFAGGVGRTDLPGGSQTQLLESIRVKKQFDDDLKAETNKVLDEFKGTFSA